MPDEPTATSWPTWLGRAGRSRTPSRRRGAGTTTRPTGATLIAPEEAVGEAERAELEADGGEQLAPLADHELGAAAADVAHQRRAARRSAAPGSTPRWMRRASSTPETISTSMPASALDPVEEVAVVLGLAHRAGRDRPHRRVEAVGDPPATGQRGDAPLDGVGLRARVMSPEPVPSRTISFSRSAPRSGRRSPSRATTRWTELVPTSTAARVAGHERRAYGGGRRARCDGDRAPAWRGRQLTPGRVFPL